jgi:acyl-CoA synthetase (AMP-forming)/AMP-acid ligase II
MALRGTGENTSDYLLARGASTDVAVVAAGRSHTYGALRAAVASLTAALAAPGLPAGSRVAVLGPNSFFWVAAYLAAMRAGHVAVPVSDRLPPEEVRRQLEFVACAAVFVDRTTRRRLSAALASDTILIGDAVLDDDPASTDPTDPDPHAVAVDPDADAALMFTSGTTTRPKAVRVTHRNLQANTNSIISYLGLHGDDRALVVLPFYYCFGASLLHTHLRVGGRVVLQNSFTFPETALDLLELQECTVFAGVPSTFQLLVRASSFGTRELPSLRLIQQAGGRLAPVLVDEVLGARNRARLFVMYGQTEATARLSYLPPEKLRDKPGSIGRGIPGVRLRVLDEAGRQVPPGTVGEIYATGENVSPGYVGDPTESAAKFTPHGLRTGDLATVDSDGDIFIHDRRDDFIKCWGHRVSSQEIEACALRIDRLMSAAAVGVPDLEAGEAITLCVVARPGTAVTPEEVLVVCREHLAKHMVPSTVLVVDALPLNPNGKVAKSDLAELARSASGARGGGL